MDLERVAAAIRPRSNWEALDLGFGLVRAWLRQVYGPWCVVMVPLWAIAIALSISRPWIGFLALWWLRPLLDRIPLFVLGRALFGAVPTARETLRALPGLLWHRFLPAVTVERLNPMRSYFLPVRQLERARGVEHGLRVAALRREGLGEAFALCLMCWLAEVILFFSFLLLFDILVPAELESPWMNPLSHLDEGWTASMSWVLGLAWLAAVLVVEPFYVGGGFGLYLNRRTRLEGWDIELVLRRMMRRLANAPAAAAAAARAVAGLGGRGVASVLAVVLLTASLLAGSPAWAYQDDAAAAAASAAEAAGDEETLEEEPVEQEPKSRQDVEAAVDKVYQLRELSGERTRTVYKWRFDREASGSDREVSPGWLSALDGLGLVLEWGMWALLGAGVAWLAVVLYRRRHLFATSDDDEVEAPAARASAGFLAELPRLPRDIAAAALAALAAGRPLEALSLLYRGALARALALTRVEVRASWTEGDCLRRLGSALPEASGGYLRRVTLAWLAAAYAHRLPAREEITGLCEEWGRHFGEVA